MFDIQEHLKQLPAEPGVYLMKDKFDNIIYVGKAKILKNRVRQYFQSSKNHSSKVKSMVKNIDKFELIADIKKDYDFIEDLKKNFTIEKLKKFLNTTNKRRHGDIGIFSKVEFFENVKEIGRDLVKEYEEDNMLEELESHMDLNKNQIIALFDGIDKNPFMLKRLGTYLSNTLAF